MFKLFINVTHADHYNIIISILINDILVISIGIVSVYNIQSDHNNTLEKGFKTFSMIYQLFSFLNVIYSYHSVLFIIYI